MLGFEWNEDTEQLEIHADKTGLRDFIGYLDKLASSENIDHLHLMTEDWGGAELSSDKQNSKAKLINHVKIFKW